MSVKKTDLLVYMVYAAIEERRGSDDSEKA